MDILYSLKKCLLLFIILCLYVFGNLHAQGVYLPNKSRIHVSPPAKELQSSMTSSQKKLSSDLLQLIDQRFLPGGTTLQAHAESMKKMKQFQSDEQGIVPVDKIKDSRVYVYIKLKPETQKNTLDPFLQKITDVDENSNLVVAWIKVSNLEKVASLDGVRSIRTVMPPVVRTGDVTTEGDGIHKTSDVRTTYSQSGSGMKVGIISDGVDTRSASQATSDLPSDGSGLTVLSNTVGGDEGTAMLEIVHDMVPSADLYFHDCGSNTVAFNSAIDDLVSAGCDVICDDIGWLLEPYFEDGTVASHVASVLSGNDIIYVSSAGNAGSSHYQGDYYPIPSSTQHDFSEGAGTGYYYLYAYMETGSNIRIVLQWNDQSGSSGNNYNLYLYSYSLGGTVASSTTVQDGDDDPLEWINYDATSGSAGDFAIIVDKISGSAKTLEVYIYAGSGAGAYTNNITPVDAIYGHPAVVGAVAVGAVRVTTPTTIESFSSQGPCTITYPSSESRDKPDIVGTDGGVITGAGSFGSWDGANWRFYGTSASAPHVAAVCAQLWAQLPSNTGDQIRDKILATSVDLGTSGFDNVFGYGRADALEAFDTYVSVATPTFDPAAGTYSSTQNVTISTTTPSATIHYTTDGTDPTESDPTYSSPVSIAENTTLKARAYRTGWTSSSIASGDYDLGFWTQTQTVSGTGSYTFNADGDGHDFVINFTSMTGSGDVTVKQYTSAPTNVPGVNVLDNYFEITVPGGITNFTANLTFQYLDGEASGYTESSDYFGIGKYNGSTNTWQWLGGTVDAGSNTVTVSGVTSCSDFAVFRRIFGDYNDDGYVDVNDFQQFASVWHQTNTGEFSEGSKARFFNVNKDTDGGDQIIDVKDFQGFATVWHNGTP